MSDSRLEKFIYAICSMDVSDLPVPLSRIEKLWNCLITGETPDFEPLSRNEKYLMAMLDRYDISNLPAPMSRGEQLLYKIAVGETDLSDVPGYLSRYEELLKYLIENGGISGGDFEYVLYTLNQSMYTLYTTAEKPVKSAILKGQTLVNLVGEKREYWSGGVPAGLYGWEFLLPYNLTSGKTYLAIFDAVGTIDESNVKVYLMDNGFNSNSGNTTSTVPTFRIGHNVVKCIATNDVHRILRIRTSFTENVAFTVSNVMLIEYQEGMENWNIPYFEGMQSVKMPVLTTVGKQLLNVNDLGSIVSTDDTIPTKPTVIDFENGIVQIEETSREYNKGYKIKVERNKDYIGTCNSTNSEHIRCKILDLNGNRLDEGQEYYHKRTFNFNSGENDYIVVAFTCHTVLKSQVQLALYEGTVLPTTYEPYKTNILTVNEDVILRGIGDVKDGLDCLTGELTQRIGEIVLDGTQSVVIPTDYGFGTKYPDSNYAVFRVEHGQANGIEEVNLLNTLMSESLKSLTWVEHQKTPQEGISNCHKKYFTISVLKSRLEEDSISGIKKWLQSNPITVQYRLETESIKTVDLSVVDQDGQPTQLGTFENVTHVSLVAENLIPEVEMEVATNLLEDTVFNLTNTFNTLYPTAAKPVKSAILKGQTLVNLSVSSGYKTVTFTPTQTYITDFQHNVEGYKPNTKYLVITEFNHDCKYKFGVNVYDTKSIFNETTYIQEGVGKVYKHILTTKSDFTECDTALRTVVYNNTEETDFSQTYRMMIIEYQDGMENWNIPYFEGMQSVKMPVLTTSNEDGTKTNILTVNEEVELRGIGDVQDTLDCLTGEVTERIGEVVLDGTQDMSSDSNGVYIQVNDVKRFLDYTGKIACDKLPVMPTYGHLANVENGISGYTNNADYLGQNWLYVRINNSINKDEVKEWLTQNPITVQYQLATESIKTVDLTTVNQDGNETKLRTFDNTTHVLLNSEGLIPTAVLTVRTKIPSASSTSLLMDDISTEQQQLETTVDEQSNNVDATMIATTEIFEETL